jgi:hypothetical protein
MSGTRPTLLLIVRDGVNHFLTIESK